MRQFRYYLSRQVDRRRLNNFKEKQVSLTQVAGGFQELTCHPIKFCSNSELQFKIQMENTHIGCIVRQFNFSLKLGEAGSVKMVRIHLNSTVARDPAMVPRCHIHIDGSHPHLPFPALNPLLTLQILCEYVEPAIGRE